MLHQPTITLNRSQLNSLIDTVVTCHKNIGNDIFAYNDLVEATIYALASDYNKETEELFDLFQTFNTDTPEETT
jgi:hypothetical protein